MQMYDGEQVAVDTYELPASLAFLREPHTGGSSLEALGLRIKPPIKDLPATQTTIDTSEVQQPVYELPTSLAFLTDPNSNSSLDSLGLRLNTATSKRKNEDIPKEQTRSNAASFVKATGKTAVAKSATRTVRTSEDSASANRSERSKVNTEKKHPWLRKALGGVALTGVSILFFQGMFTGTPGEKTEQRTIAVESDNSTPRSTTTTVEATTTVPETTTTTAKPYVPYSTSPIESALNTEGKLIDPAFKISIDALCEDSIYIYEMEQSRVGEIGDARNATPADVMVPDQTPLTPECERVNEYKAENPGAITRIDRIRDSFDIVDGERVNAAYYQPTGVHLNDNMYPGEKGNFVIMWHGSTKNAAGANTAVLQPGDTMDINRDDGYVSVYEFIGSEIYTVPDEDDNSAEAVRRREEVTKIIWGYSNPTTGSVATTIRCGDKDGKTGSDEAREVGRWKLKYSYQLPYAS